MDYKGKGIIYQSDDGLTKIDVRLEEDTVWLTQLQLADLYQTSKSNKSYRYGAYSFHEECLEWKDQSLIASRILRDLINIIGIARN